MKHLLIAAASSLAFALPAAADPVRDATAKELPSLMALYKELHAAPELSQHEVKTAARMAAEARKAGYTVTEKVGGTGVVAVLKNGDGPTILIRADMDGLPVTEETGLPFASTVRDKTPEGVETGVMHACAHDTHMTAWVGTLRNLAAMKGQWKGTLVMVAQPAEENSVGALAMLNDGLYARFGKPSHAIAFHNSAALPAGTIGIRSGPTFASVDSVDIVVKGVGGHGAYPATTKDPIVLGARIVSALQTIVAREVDPLDSAVITVGSFQGGTRHNIIPEQALLLLTVRAYTPEVRKQLLEGIARIAKGEAIAAGVPEDRMPIVTVREPFTPPAVSTDAFAGQLKTLFTARFGKDRVSDIPPTMAGEDFGRYHIADPTIQSVIYWVGGVPQDKWDAAKANGGKGLPSLHSSKWAPDAEKVIGTAAEAMTAAALNLLKR
jgi:hippurate hydrolase